MQFLKGVFKPEYLFRPRQIVMRILREVGPAPREARVVVLPWKARLTVDPRDIIGSVVWKLGVYELVVSETLWRLIDRGESVFDVGANIGHMTTLMAVRAGKSGHITAFEPHPATFERLSNNIEPLNRLPDAATVQLRNVALSDAKGKKKLILPKDFASNAGTPYIEESSADGREMGSIPVTIARFDDLFTSAEQIPRLLKVDVEGHEYQVFRGAEKWLRSRTIRDVVFEDHGAYPTPAIQLLEGFGYALYRLDRGFFGPLLVNPRSPQRGVRWEPSNFLATADPTRARERMAPRGWQCL
jgi:FkbM family methyltransferase